MARYVKYITVLLLMNVALGEVQTSELFQKTLKKIARKNVQKVIIDNLDPMLGIVATDLINKIIFEADREDVIRSAINVTGTMVLLSAVRAEVEELITQNPQIIKQARRQNLDRRELIAYSSLYYYFSEREKYDLYIDTSLPDYHRIKERLEKLYLNNDKKWVMQVSGTLIRKRWVERNYIYDVRINEFFKYICELYIFEQDSVLPKVKLAADDLFNAFSNLEKRKLYESLGLRDVVLQKFDISVSELDFGKVKLTTLDPNMLIQRIFDLYSGAYKNLKSEIDFGQLVLAPVETVRKYSFRDQEYLKTRIFKAFIQLINDLYLTSKRQYHGVEYMVSLAGTAFLQDESATLNFTVIDQIRYYPGIKAMRIYLYAGGFIDPILKNVGYESNLKYYLMGVGVPIGQGYITLNAGIPYPEINLNDFVCGVTVGYEIPIGELFD